MDIYDTIIIGGGPAGYSAALYIARNARSVLVIEQLSAGGQMATTGLVENYPGFSDGIDGFELAEKMQQGAEKFGAKTIYDTVTSVDVMKNPKIVQGTEKTYYAKTVVIATGANPKELGVPKERQLRGKGVAYCATCDGMYYKNKKVVVIGGGNSAVTNALFLSKICKEVTLIHRKNRLTASSVYERQLKDSPINIIWDSTVKEIIADKRVTGIKLENNITHEKKSLVCDGIFVSIGRVPNTELFKDQLKTDDYGYIIADETTKTNIAGVFAIGDVRTKSLRQIITAASDGAVCSNSIEEYLTK